MNLSLYENASALRGLEQYQNVIANNIAASHVAGYKKVAVSFEGVDGGEIARSTHGRLRNEMPGSFPVMKNQIDFNEGELKETSNPLDLAINGEGFFALMNADGGKVFTRDGQFYTNSEGTIVNSMGHEFSDQGGNPITLIPGQPDPLIDQEGQIFQGEQLIAKLGVFTFEDPVSQLQKVGGGFIPKDENTEAQEAIPQSFKNSPGFS